ncbi:MAG: glycosyltransferase [Candidatus Eiseniibacteriota bacterium]|nr:MAG: glycosyltransferase [Candidatus Eisenbacteria bacterium]
MAESVSERRPRGSPVSEVSVIVVNYKSENFLPACLDSIRQATSATDVDVVVVDNSKGGGAEGILKERFPGGRYIANERNLGYARAVNQGISASDSPFVFIVNPDTVAEPGSLDKLVQFMRDNPDAGIVGPKLLNPDGTVQLSCRTFYTFKTILLRRTFLGKVFKNSASVRRHLMLDWDHDSAVAVDWVLGAAMLVRRAAISEVGPMDERFFLYFEDVDWCYRMKAAGWSTYYHADSHLVHHYRRQSADARFGKAKRAHLESWLRFWEKWNLLLYLLKRNRELVSPFLLFLADVAAIGLSFYLAYLLRANMGFVLTKPTPSFEVYQNFMLVAIVVGVAAMGYVGLYGRRKIGDWIDLLFDVSRAMLLTNVILMASTFLLYVRIYSRAALLVFLPVSILVVLTERLLFRLATRKLALTRVNLRRVLVVGSGPAAERARRAVLKEAEEGLELAGFLDTSDWFRGDTAEVRTGPEALWQVVHAQRAGEVVVADSSERIRAMWPLIKGLPGRGVQVALATELDVLLGEGDRIEEMGGVGFVSLKKRPAPGGVMKRLVELAFALPASVVLLPLMAIGALGLLARGTRPVFRREEVVGEEGRRFGVWTLDCGDDSILGKVLLGTGLNWAPLLLSVLGGQLALVGVRPRLWHPEEDANRTTGGKPGVFGMWKLGIDREDSDHKDSEYLATWSASLDIKIVMRCLLVRRRTF